MKRGVLLIFLVFSLMIISNAYSITESECKLKGINVCNSPYNCQDNYILINQTGYSSACPVGCPASTCSDTHADAVVCGIQCGGMKNDNCNVARACVSTNCVSPNTCGGGGTANVCGISLKSDGLPCSIDSDCLGGKCAVRPSDQAKLCCTPTQEICDNKDNDCDGTIDESLTQIYGIDTGECSTGIKTCQAGAWAVTTPEVTATTEICNDNKDNDCDTHLDGEDASCVSINDFPTIPTSATQGVSFIVDCTISAANANCVGVKVNNTVCSDDNFVGWIGKIAQFRCSSSSSGDNIPVKCYISNKVGDSCTIGTDTGIPITSFKEKSIKINPSSCAGLLQSQCTGTCKWCPLCSGVKRYSGDQCISTASTCEGDVCTKSCGAKCDANDGTKLCTSIDSNLYSGGTATCKTDCSGWDVNSCVLKGVTPANTPPQYISGVTTSNSNPAINTQVTLTCDFTDDKGDSALNVKIWVRPVDEEAWVIDSQDMQWFDTDFKYSFSVPSNWAGKTIKATCNAYDIEKEDAFGTNTLSPISPWTADKDSLMIVQGTITPPLCGPPAAGTPVCGDGIIQQGEDCDCGSNNYLCSYQELNCQSCPSPGQLSCYLPSRGIIACKFNYEACNDPSRACSANKECITSDDCPGTKICENGVLMVDCVKDDPNCNIPPPPPECQPTSGQACGCDGKIDCDGNCVGSTPELTFYRDADNDGYGSSQTTTACSQPEGYVTNNQDCDDTMSLKNPGKTENTQALCSDNIDNNCNGLEDCRDSSCSDITRTDGKKCCTYPSQCICDQTCDNYVCVPPSKKGNSKCCYGYTECMNLANQNKGNPLKWPQSGNCACNGIVENPECI